MTAQIPRIGKKDEYLTFLTFLTAQVYNELILLCQLYLGVSFSGNVAFLE